MNKTYLKLIAIAALTIMLIPIFPALPTAAQTTPIVGYSSEIVPGGTAYVTINVNNPGQLVTIQLTNGNNPSQAWVTVTRTFALAGTYKVEFSVPELLPNIGPWGGELAKAYINVTMGYTTYSTPAINIIPVVEVTPSSTTNIDLTGASKSITVKAYGLPTDVTISYVNVSATGITKYWNVGPLTPNNDGSITISNLNFYHLLPSPWLPKGTFTVILSTDKDYVNGNESAGSLSIEPLILVDPTSGHGTKLDLASIKIEGYGFPANAEISKVIFTNENFTINYTFTADGSGSTIYVDSNGRFIANGLTPQTDMAAGLYYITICWRTRGIPSTEVWSGSSAPSPYTLVSGTVYESSGSLTDDTGYATFTYESYANLTSSRPLVGEYQNTAGTDTTIDFTFGGYTYRLIATNYNSTAHTVDFELLNLSTTPASVVFTVTGASMSSNTAPGYDYANLVFNITPTVSYANGTTHPPTGNYVFYSEYYANATINVGYMNLSELTYTINSANVSITYSNSDTGTTKTYFFSTEAGNLSVTDNRLSATIAYIVDGTYNYSVSFSASFNLSDADFNTSTLEVHRYTITVPPGSEECQQFRAPGYIVRPYLTIIGASGAFALGSEVSIAAYGYAPNTTITFLWDEKIPINITNATNSFSGNTVKTGSNGDVNFTFVIPSTTSYGAHYLRGRDSYGYEYTIQIIVGAKFYWSKVKITPLTNTSSNEVTASHPVYGQVVASICGNYAASKFCGICTKVTAGGFDYIGDEIKVTVSGLYKGEVFTVYFGNIKIGTYVANHTVETISFLVPPVPEGTYYISIDLPTGSHTITKFFNGTTLVDAGIHVVPKLLVVSLGSGSKAHVPILVGPGIIKVIGTGFPVGASFKSLSINGTAVLSYQNGDLWNWYVDTDGTVKAYGGLEPGLFIPMLEPGLYEISLVYSIGNETGKSVPGYVYVINNLTNVATQKSLANFEASVKASLDDLGSSIEDLMTMATQANSQLTGLQVSLSQIGFKVDTANNYLTTMMSNMNTAMSDLSSIKGTLTSMQGTLSSVNSGVNDIKSKLSSLKLSVDLTPVTSRLDSISSDVAALKAGQTSISNGISALSGKVTQVQSTLSGISSQLSGISSTAQQALSAANAAKASADNAASAASGAANAVNAAKTELAGKIDTGVYVLYIATIFAVLAFAFAILAWAAARKASSK